MFIAHSLTYSTHLPRNLIYFEKLMSASRECARNDKIQLTIIIVIIILCSDYEGSEQDTRAPKNLLSLPTPLLWHTLVLVWEVRNSSLYTGLLLLHILRHAAAVYVLMQTE